MKCLDNLRLTHGVRGKRDENSEGKRRDKKNEKSEKERKDIEENIPCGDAVKSKGSSCSHGTSLCAAANTNNIRNQILDRIRIRIIFVF